MVGYVLCDDARRRRLSAAMGECGGGKDEEREFGFESGLTLRDFSLGNSGPERPKGTKYLISTADVTNLLTGCLFHLWKLSIT